ncbi:hypothetical protein SISSUDRAFT_1067349 [Sistotremastrum suecicum HHB10207 ss-3]|uniref:WD40 repeat-like protein n=1 Tax=Sistotremastrum suecicum HHB10207 ss-3 TaxID=1314776 RepID=A0A165X849_9AGAM|nr:hypothetical protein SISSUDRAFT_1067349 [Sistotremastrum suecicum HHB10207 ss-3]
MLNRRIRTDRSAPVQDADSTHGFLPSRIFPQNSDVESVALSPDGRYIAIRDSEGFLDVYSLVTGRHLLDVFNSIFSVNNGGVDHYCWAQPYVHPFNIGLICAYTDGGIQAIEYRSDGAKWTAAAPIDAHYYGVTSMCIDKTNNYICTVSVDALRLWRIDDDWNLKLVAIEKHDFDRGGCLLTGAFFCGSLLYLPIGGKLVRCWETGERILDRRGDLPLLFEITETFVSPDEKWLIALQPGGGGHLYSIPDLEHCMIVLGQNEIVKSVSFMEARRAFVFGDPSGAIHIRSWETSETLFSLPHHIRHGVAGAVHSRTIDSATIIASGTSLSALFDSATVKIWTDSLSNPPAVQISSPRINTSMRLGTGAKKIVKKILVVHFPTCVSGRAVEAWTRGGKPLLGAIERLKHQTCHMPRMLPSSDHGRSSSDPLDATLVAFRA